MAQPPLAYITGASGGIGGALAQRYRAAGWRVAIVVRREPPAELADCIVYRADVRDPAALAAAGHDCIARHGLPDVVVANAGISFGMDTAQPEDIAVLQDTLATNVVGVAATFQPFVAPMRARGSGRLVGIASVAGIRGLPGHGAYCASKAAVIAYCESLRGECAPHGVRVVTIAPGYIDTPMTRGNPFPMPFLMDAQGFADRSFRAIERGTRFAVIPAPMAWAARVLRILPGALFDLAFRNAGRKPRRGSQR